MGQFIELLKENTGTVGTVKELMLIYSHENSTGTGSTAYRVIKYKHKNRLGIGVKSYRVLNTCKQTGTGGTVFRVLNKHTKIAQAQVLKVVEFVNTVQTQVQHWYKCYILHIKH